MKFKNILGILIVVGLIVAVSGCTNTGNNSTQSKGADLKILNSTLVKGNGVYFITGYLKNEGNTKYSYVELEGKLFDKNGNVLESDITNTLNFAPGETWQFKIEIYSDKGKPANYAVDIAKTE